MKKLVSPYQKDEIILRLISNQDLDQTLAWRNLESHRQWFNKINIISKDEHYRWYEEYNTLDNDLVFIVTNQQEIKYGQLSIYRINWIEKNAEFGRFLSNPVYEGHGFMKQACLCALALSKEILKLKKLVLEVKPENKKAIHIYTSCGFTNCGLNENKMLIMSIDL